MKRIAILWKDGQQSGSISTYHASIANGMLKLGSGFYDKTKGTFSASGPSRLELALQDVQISAGAQSSIITVLTEFQPFSFFLRDVIKDYPIYIKAFDVIITEADDGRNFKEIQGDIQSRGLLSKLQQIEWEPEESYPSAANQTRALTCETWLGLSRDMRIFGVGFRGGVANDRMWDWVQPRYHGNETELPENNNLPVRYHYLIGRGLGCEYKINRNLEENTLPILHGKIQDDDVSYQTTSFVSYESTPLNLQTLQGTHYIVADRYGHGYMFTPEQRSYFESIVSEELNKQEETVFYFQAIAINKSRVPRYAWFKNVFPNGNAHSHSGIPYSFDGKRGFGTLDSGRVYAVSKLNGIPLPQEEIAVLLKPGERAVFEFYLPHRPVSDERAASLIQQEFNNRHQECADFWKFKLTNATEVNLPERRIEEMMKAGLLHLDLVTYGREPDQTAVPTIGVYTAIGSESSPIIQFMDSMGLHDLARRSLMYFLDKQHDSGFIQNFGGYMLETGAALWSIGEHYRYTKDLEWIQQIKPKLHKAHRYLMEWRKRNLRDDLIGKGYGMLEGKTADPEDPFRSYMLNGYAYLGMKHLAELLAEIRDPEYEHIERDAEQLKNDIRTSLKETMANSPVIPLGDGSWVPTSAPWANYRGPLSLYAEGGKWLTHGSSVARDSLLGPLYLVIQEVFEPHEQEAEYLLNFHNELMCLRNVALSQPYYSIHPWIHLKRGEVKAFLKSFYNGFAGLADRETYTFWEHYWHASPHKTHEEGWFLMQCRWMLYMEEKQSLKLLPGIPRAWLEDGKSISLRNAASYFGHFTMEVQSKVGHGEVQVHVQFDPKQAPETVEIRLPHPDGQKARQCSYGAYDPLKETVHAKPIEGKVQFTLLF